MAGFNWDFPEPEYHGEIQAVLDHLYNDVSAVRDLVGHAMGDVFKLEEWLDAHAEAFRRHQTEHHPSSPQGGARAVQS